MRRRAWFVVVAVVAVAAGVGAAVALQNRPVVSPAAVLPPMAPDEVRAAEFGKRYPREYQSYLKNRDQSKGPSLFGGSVPADKLEEYPYLRVVFAGYGFSKEYNEDRGHVYTLEDVNATARPHDKLNCMTCKSAQVPAAIAQHGEAWYALPFVQHKDEFTEPVGCADCHDPVTMELRITRPALIEALQAMGKDPATLTHQEMRSLVCAQCHVEYHFPPPTYKVVFPWRDGLDPEKQYAYYQSVGFSDWTHPATGTPLLKAQHPDYEMFVDGPHHAAGLACADCHMPYVVEGNVKYTSHWWTSPLKHMESTCTVCHREPVDDLRERVFYTQRRTKELMDRAGAALVSAISAIERAQAAGVDAEAVAKARALHREAQWYFDWVASENSMGFHNPQKALSTLGKAIDLARLAELTVAAPGPDKMKAGTASEKTARATALETGAYATP